MNVRCGWVKVKDGKEEALDSIVTPMLTENVSRFLGTRQEVEINELGCNGFMHTME